jgi:hypothetical protein
MDSAEAHRVSQAVTGQPVVTAGTGLLVSANRAARSFDGLLDAMSKMSGAVDALLEALDDLVDDEGREIWLRAGEVELDQWAEGVINCRDALRRAVRGVAS